MEDINAVDELLKAEQEANEVIRSAYKEKERQIKEAKVIAQEEI